MASCSLRLRTLGGLAVDGDPRPALGAATQRRPLALLALLASARERGVSRDKLLGYLWPESSEEKARHLLNQALYALRRNLAADDLFLGSSELRLNPGALGADMREFEEALDRGDPERAAAIYAGPFLDGFFRAHAPGVAGRASARDARSGRKSARRSPRSRRMVASTHGARSAELPIRPRPDGGARRSG